MWSQSLRCTNDMSVLSRETLWHPWVRFPVFSKSLILLRCTEGATYTNGQWFNSIDPNHLKPLDCSSIFHCADNNECCSEFAESNIRQILVESKKSSILYFSEKNTFRSFSVSNFPTELFFAMTGQK